LRTGLLPAFQQTAFRRTIIGGQSSTGVSTTSICGGLLSTNCNLRLVFYRLFDKRTATCRPVFFPVFRQLRFAAVFFRRTAICGWSSIDISTNGLRLASRNSTGTSTNELRLFGPVFYRHFDERIATCEPVFYRLLDERIATCEPEFYRHFDKGISTSQAGLLPALRRTNCDFSGRYSTGTSMNELRLFGPVFYRRFGERIETCGMFEGAMLSQMNYDRTAVWFWFRYVMLDPDRSIADPGRQAYCPSCPKRATSVLLPNVFVRAV
jgi:hypothetical protein